MAIRYLWFFLGLVLAALAATQAAATIPAVLDDLTPGLLASDYVALFKSDLVVRLACALAVGAVLAFLIVYGGLALLDGVGVALVSNRLRSDSLSGPGLLDPQAFVALVHRYTPYREEAQAYAQTIHPEVSSSGKSARKVTQYAATAPARRYFGARDTVAPLLFNWFFDPLPLLLLGVGIFELGLTVIWSLAPTAETLPGLVIRPGVVALTVLLGPAFLILVLKRCILLARTHQNARFSRVIDGLYPNTAEDQVAALAAGSQQNAARLANAIDGLSDKLGAVMDAQLQEWLKAAEANQKSLEKELVTGIQEALSKPMQALQKASEKTGKAQVAQSQEVLDAVLKAFIKDLNKHFAAQTAELKASLEETREAAAAMDAAYKQSLESHQQQVAQELGAYAGAFGQTAANFEALQGVMENLITLISPMMRQIIDNQEGLMNALEQEASASKVIGRAASELSSAAQASRDTVERFITLAERLREVGRSAPAGPLGAPPPIDKAVIRELRSLKDSVFSDASAGKE